MESSFTAKLGAWPRSSSIASGRQTSAEVTGVWRIDRQIRVGVWHYGSKVLRNRITCTDRVGASGRRGIFEGLISRLSFSIKIRILVVLFTFAVASTDSLSS